MSLNYALYDVRSGRRLTTGPTTGAYGDTYGYPIWTGAEFHFLLNHIKKMGFHVYANSHHGGINRTAHSPKSWHYVKDGQGRSLAADIGTHGDVNERNRIIRDLIPLLDRLGVGWHYARDGGVPGHYDHIHIDVSHWGRKGGSQGTGYGYYSTRKKQDMYKALGGVSASPGGAVPASLNAGFSTTHIRWVQTQLKALGLYKDAVDGYRGNNTQKAIKAFQSSKGLKADGLPGKATENALRAATAKPKAAAVKKRKPRAMVANLGSKGELVQIVQKIAKTTVDGSFGNGTVNAVKKLQRSLGVTADGSFGPGTAKAYMAKVAPVRTLGTTGQSVRLIQYIAGLKTDGSFGPATQQAVKEMQAWAGLTPDGSFGAQSREKLFIGY